MLLQKSAVSRKRCAAPTLRARRPFGDGRAWGRIDTSIWTTIVTSLVLPDRGEKVPATGEPSDDLGVFVDVVRVTAVLVDDRERPRVHQPVTDREPRLAVAYPVC